MHDGLPHGGLSTQPGRASFIVTAISMVLVTLSLVLRLWAKFLRRRRFMTHDYLYFASYVLAMGYSALFLYGIYPNVIGMHQEDAVRLYPDRLVRTLKIVASSTFIWATATTLVKLSLLSLYLHVFKSELIFRILAYIVAILCVMFTIAVTILGALFCRPFAYNWDRSIEGGRCIDSPKFQLSTAVVNIILDFFVVLLPLPVLWSLHMSWKRKVMLSGIFSLGLCICAMNLTRTIIVVNQNLSDVTHEIARVGLFSVLEVNVGMICAALPTCGPLFFADSARRRRSSAAGDGSGSSSGKVNSFVRMRVAGVGAWGAGAREAGLSTLDESRIEDGDEDGDCSGDVVPLTRVGIGTRGAPADDGEGGWTRPANGNANGTANGAGIHVVTDIRVQNTSRRLGL
ncbi:hypothetical protein BJY00DRAFT_319216 [Aspergillus carlsbadensis]|nr:hypothetical protein BJY00DRAFT_319216 [Aspergillus carlsbadensis]